MSKVFFIKTLLVFFVATFSFSVHAATLSLTGKVNYNANGFKGSISQVQNITAFLPGASAGFYVPKPNPAAMSAAHVQTALSAAGSSFVVTDFYKIDNPVKNSLQTAASGIGFSGFLMKYGTTTLIGLFSTPISSLDFITHDGKDVSHIAYFNTSALVSEVPLPAAMWLFAPALMGLLGFRRCLMK